MWYGPKGILIKSEASMDLKEIGFYTLSDDRAKQASETSPLQRCELILTARCNFRCPYCRHVGVWTQITLRPLAHFSCGQKLA